MQNTTHFLNNAHRKFRLQDEIAHLFSQNRYLETQSYFHLENIRFCDTLYKNINDNKPLDIKELIRLAFTKPAFETPISKKIQAEIQTMWVLAAIQEKINIQIRLYAIRNMERELAQIIAEEKLKYLREEWINDFQQQTITLHRIEVEKIKQIQFLINDIKKQIENNKAMIELLKARRDELWSLSTRLDKAITILRQEIKQDIIDEFKKLKTGEKKEFNYALSEKVIAYYKSIGKEPPKSGLFELDKLYDIEEKSMINKLMAGEKNISSSSEEGETKVTNFLEETFRKNLHDLPEDMKAEQVAQLLESEEILNLIQEGGKLLKENSKQIKNNTDEKLEVLSYRVDTKEKVDVKIDVIDEKIDELEKRNENSLNEISQLETAKTDDKVDLNDLLSNISSDFATSSKSNSQNDLDDLLASLGSDLDISAISASLNLKEISDLSSDHEKKSINDDGC